jgi:hypothetical protein
MSRGVFWFHYNKPASMSAGKVQVSIHFKKQCLIVDNLECFVPCRGKIRKTQPRFVMQGIANNITISNGIATIT